ncbi:MFS transporter [soil metagenome]
MPWVRILALAFSQLVAWGTLYYAFAVIIGPMGAEMGWTKPQMNGALSVGLAVSGFSAYFVGPWIDARGGRILMTFGAVLGAVSLGLWSQVTALWQLYAVWVLIGIASAMALYEAAFAVTAHMVPGDYRRGITVITLLGGLASTVFIPATHWLTDSLGWRQALLVLAIVELGICTAIPLLALPATAKDNIKPEIGAPSGGGKVFTRVRRRPVFWLLVTSFVAYAFFFTAVLFNLLPLLEGHGFTTTAAILLYSMIGPAQVAGRLFIFAADRLLPLAAAGLAGTLLPVAAMILLMTTEPDSSLSLLFPILFGAGMGIKTLVLATAAPEFLEETGYGALQGVVSLPVLVAQSLSPFAAAFLWQAGGDYRLLQSVLLGMAIVSAIAFALAAWMAGSRKSAAANLRSR